MPLLINNTLLAHLPDWLLPPKDAFEEQRLVVLAQNNCRRRITLNYSHDVLTAPQLVNAANDLLQSLAKSTLPTFRESDLERYLIYGLITPRYRVQPRMTALVIKRDWIFTPEGRLEKIVFSKERPYPSLRPYRARGAVTDFPAAASPKTRDFARGTSLFTFTQVGEVVGIHQLVFRPINILTVTPASDEQMRNDILTVLRKKQGVKRCENPACTSLVPLGHPRFCSETCKERARRARKPKSTPRVERSYQRKAPSAFTSSIDLPTLPEK